VSTALPLATYRLQFEPEFTLADARGLVDYLHALGVSHVYASPLLQARTGSTHGYDVTDPGRINDELGGEDGLEALIDALHRHGMGLVLDIVPNHMAASIENPWWRDVLTFGEASPYAGFFDIDWHPAGGVTDARLVLPVLGKPYGQALEGRELRLTFGEDGFYVRYYDRRLPLDPRTYPRILSSALVVLEADTSRDEDGIAALRTIVGSLEASPVAHHTTAQARREEWRTAGQGELWRLATSHPAVGAEIAAAVRRFNGRRGEPASFDLLDGLLRAQAYRLSYWRAAREKLNYRRFFNINDLVGVRAERPVVFQATHRKVIDLVRRGWIAALRVDHVDGLYDPPAYLNRLRTAAVDPYLPIYVEKILSSGERLPERWPVAGTTGYEFAAAVIGVMVEATGLDVLRRSLTRGQSTADFGDVAYAAKRHVARELFPGELQGLASELLRLAEEDRYACDLSARELVRVLVEVTACLAVYRTYVTEAGVSTADREVLERALDEARRRNPGLSPRALGFLRRLLLLDLPRRLTEAQRNDWLHFVMRWQQVTPPVVAKGVEDTALYRYTPLLALNDVGSDPGAPAMSVDDFHRFNLDRAQCWPLSLSATSTHDSKRSEDVRARIAVLSELAGEWQRRLRRWRRMNHDHAEVVDGTPVPTAALEALLYQDMVGAWPLSAADERAFLERFCAYLVKAVREAKRATSWLRPDERHEQALLRFVRAITADRDGPFIRDFLAFHQVVAFHGALNSLAMVLLKITGPGTPDLYRGNELWDFSLVDPDNRRPVDFALRVHLLGELERPATPTLAAELIAGWRDGRVKLHLTATALRLRRKRPELFLEGDYVPLAIDGPRRDHVIAFARRVGESWVLAAAPRLTTRLVRSERPPLGRRCWQATRLVLPGDAPSSWRNLLTGEELDGETSMARILASFPVALLLGGEDSS
jgi:(1->4)-alpha-D-glucan 1-alpha-D-glucosylmutase